MGPTIQPVDVSDAMVIGGLEMYLPPVAGAILIRVAAEFDQEVRRIVDPLQRFG